MEKFENAACFLRLGLPFTLFRHEKRSFWKMLFKPEECENANFVFSCGRKHCHNGTFRERWLYGLQIIMHVISFPEQFQVSSTVASSNLFGVVWTETCILCL